MSWEKVKEVRLFGVTNQATSVVLPIGDSSGGTHTSFANPLRGTLLWDRAMFVLTGVSVAGGATGGTWHAYLRTDAVPGYSNLSVAEALSIGPNSPSTIVLDNVHQSPSAPLPTELNLVLGAAGGGIWCQVWCLAKQYRGVLGTPGGPTSERIIAGTMFRGTSAGAQFGDDAGISADLTFTLGTTGTALGMHRMRLWDSAFYWGICGATVAGTWDADVITKIGGTTVSIASTGAAGILNSANEIQPLINNFYGQSPNPTHIIWTEVTAGGISDARVVALAKSGRGSMAKE